MKTQNETEKLMCPIRYMLEVEGAAPQFATGQFNSTPLGTVGGERATVVVTAPNLTGRLNAICAYAEKQLASTVAPEIGLAHNIVFKIAPIVSAGRVRFMEMRHDAMLRLHDAEFIMLVNAVCLETLQRIY
jgi:hypothetical protein